MSELMDKVKCPHCNETHYISIENFKIGWNVVWCYQHTDDIYQNSKGCGKYFNVYCILAATEIKKVINT